MLGTLIFHRIEQQPGADLKLTILNIASQKMGLLSAFERDFSLVYRVRLIISGLENDKVVPAFFKIFFF